MTIFHAQGFVCPKNNPSPAHSSREQDVRTLKDLWQHKEYRLFPRAVLRYLRHDQTITDAAKLCWQALFELAFFDSNWSITVSKSELAQELNKSPSTIARLLNQLEQADYIKRHHRIEDNAWQASCIDVRLPQAALAQLSSAQDRKKPTHSEHNPNVALNPDDQNINDTDVLLQDDGVNQDNDAQNSTCEVLLGMPAPSNPDASGYPEDATLVDAATVSVAAQETSSPHNESLVIPSPNLQQGLSTNETRKNNNKFNKINTTTEPVVVNFITSKNTEWDETLSDSETQMQQYQTQIQALNAQLRTPQPNDAKWALLKQLALLEGALADAKQQQVTAKQQKQKAHAETQRLANLTSNRHFCQQLSGPRPVSDFQLRRIEKSLQDAAIPSSDRIRVLNEIVFEIRFGSLTHQRDTQRPLTTNHAINIALKLVREGRWQVPVPLTQYRNGTSLPQLVAKQ